MENKNRTFTLLMVGLMVGLPLLLCGLIEGGLRLAGQQPFGASQYFVPDENVGYRWKAGFTGPIRDDEGEEYVISITEQHLREDQIYAIPKPEGVTRILVVGDSVVAGEGVLLEDTFIKFMERDLAGRCGSPQVINGGIVGYNAQQIGEWLATYGMAYEPDLVIVTYYTNDPAGRFEQPDIGGVVGWLRDNSALFGWMLRQAASGAVDTSSQEGGSHAFMDEYRAKEWHDDPAAFETMWEQSQQEWAQSWSAEAMDRMTDDLSQTFAVTGQTPALLLIAPPHPQVGAPPEIWPDDVDVDYPQTRLSVWAAEQGIPVIDPLPALRDAPWDATYIDWSHWTPTGHRIVADQILTHPAFDAWCADR